MQELELATNPSDKNKHRHFNIDRVTRPVILALFDEYQVECKKAQHAKEKYEFLDSIFTQEEGSKRVKIAHFGPFWAILTHFGPFGPLWAIMAQYSR